MGPLSARHGTSLVLIEDDLHDAENRCDYVEQSQRADKDWSSVLGLGAYDVLTLQNSSMSLGLKWYPMAGSCEHT